MKTTNLNSFPTIAFVVTFLISLTVVAQPDDDIEFFTDSDIKKSIFGIDIYATPNITSSNVLQEHRARIGDEYTYLSRDNKGGFGTNYGVGILISPNRTLDFRLGVQYGVYTFQYNDVEIFDLNDQVLTTGTSEVQVAFIDIPIKMAFHQPLGDRWEVEYGIGLEFNFLRDYQNTLSLEANSFFDQPTIEQNFTDSANVNNLTLTIHLGANYRITESLHLIFTPNFRYVFRSLVPNESQNQEAFYTIGALTGLRYRF